jgi:hypothetical protein
MAADPFEHSWRSFLKVPRLKEGKPPMKYPNVAPTVSLLVSTMAGWDKMLAGDENIRLTALGTYASGIFNSGGAEIVAHDGGAIGSSLLMHKRPQLTRFPFGTRPDRGRSVKSM